MKDEDTDQPVDLFADENTNEESVLERTVDLTKTMTDFDIFQSFFSR